LALSDGKIVVAGYAEIPPSPPFNTDFLIARLLPNGKMDRRFGREGILFVDFKNGTDAAHALALDQTGRIVVAGDGRVGGAGPTGTGHWPAGFIALTRLLANGRLDAKFGRGGKVEIPFDKGQKGEVTTMIVTRNGRIVTGGSVARTGMLFSYAPGF
ncbi:MAG: hypothetical protein HY541_08285, partial [Deltaproteobacteria bacterium]|nr:hypothetical protein [Deltaproteobacteria bacterium]